MSNQRYNPENLPDEKKVWRGVSMTPYYPGEKSSLDPKGVYFQAIEELQGAWIGEGKDKYWEEAEGGTLEFEIPTPEDIKRDHPEASDFATKKVEILRSRRYVLKQFLPNGKVKNVHDGAYSGPRQYQQS